MGRAASPIGWAHNDWFTLNEATDVFSVSLYTVPEIGYQREAYNRTVMAVHPVASPMHPVFSSSWCSLAVFVVLSLQEVFHLNL